MKYKIQDTMFNDGTTHQKLLKQRGVEYPEQYLSTSDTHVSGYTNLENINQGYNLLNKIIQEGGGIGILVDSDFDGYASASILYSYLKDVFGVVCRYYIHPDKEHGLSSKELFKEILEDGKSGKIKLIITPDSASNDVKESKELSKVGVEVLSLDHHQIEKNNDFAVVVNPQLSPNYSNKYLSGAGTTWQFLRKIDDETWNSKANRYLDLVATSLIADSMDIKNLENRRLIELGLSNIENGLLKEFIEKQSYSMGGEVSINGIAFYISPLVNAVIRAGTMDEKVLMFRAFIEDYEEFDYEKRDKSIVKESIYAKVVRLATNAKSRQERIVGKAIDLVEKDIVDNKRNDNKILFALADETIEKTLTGLVAMKISAKYGKPCVILRRNENGFYSGSGRNIDKSPLKDFKGFLESLNSTSWVSGHSGAFGIFVSLAQLKLTIQRANEKLKDFDFSKVFNVDFEFDDLNLSAPSTQFLKELYNFRFYVGQGISEPLLLLKNIQINSQKISIFGKGAERNIWKFPLTEEIDVIKFKCDESDYMLDKFGGSDFNWDGVELKLDVICKVGKSDFNGESKYTLIVEDYDVK